MDERTAVKEAVEAAEKNDAVVVKSETNLTFNDFSWMDYPTVAKLANVAKGLANSKLVPDSFKGDTWGVMIAMEMSNRMHMGLLQVLQSLYIVQGKPSWSGQFCISAINACGKFSPLEFVWYHDKDGHVTGCSAQATSLITGHLCTSPAITWDTVTGFGWDKKNNSMWNIPGQREQMYQYRAAAYFARTFCPEVLGGLYTKEENQDITGNYSDQPEKVVVNLKKEA